MAAWTGILLFVFPQSIRPLVKMEPSELFTGTAILQISAVGVATRITGFSHRAHQVWSSFLRLCPKARVNGTYISFLPSISLRGFEGGRFKIPRYTYEFILNFKNNL
jgi:hypothetical protein